MQNISFKRGAVIFAVAVAFFVAAVGYHIAAGQYDTVDLTFNEMIDEGAQIKDFSIEDGVICSLSDDPWINYVIDNKIGIKTITVDVEYISDNYTASDIYIMHSDQSFTQYPVVFEKGENIIKIDDSNIASVRFDFLNGDGEKIKINNIIFNDTFINVFLNNIRELGEYIYIVPLSIKYVIIPGVLILAFVFIVKNVNKFKGSKKIFLLPVSISAALVVVYAISLIISSKVVYKEKVMDFSELAAGAKDFEVDEENNTITSTGYDSWIYVPYNNGNDVRTITITLNNWQQSEDDADSEIYIFYEKGFKGFDMLTYRLNDGENTINIPSAASKINAYRFDFTYSSGVSIGLDSIVFNRSDVVRAALMSDVSAYGSKVFIWILLLFMSVLGMYIGGIKKYSEKYSGIMTKFGKFFTALMMLAGFLCSVKCPLAAGIPLMLTGYYIWRYASVEGCTKSQKVFIAVISAFSVFLAFSFAPETGINALCSLPKGGQSVNMFITVLCIYMFILTSVLLFGKTNENKYGYILNCKNVYSIIREVCLVLFMTGSFEVLAKVFFEEVPFINAVGGFLSSDTLWINVMLWGVIYFAVKNIGGNILGNAGAIIVYLFFFIGNFVKLKYHDTIFLPMDILQIGDFFGIVFMYVPAIVFILLILVIIGVSVFFVVKYRKTIMKYGPNIYISAVSIFAMITLSNMIDKNAFIDMGFDVTQTWLVAEDCIEKEGLITYSYTKYRELLKIYPKASDNYSETYMAEMKNEFDSMESGTESDIKPDVILIMEESMFDVANVPDVDFSMAVDDNIRKYEKARTISPKYGGGTASVEFEALTGMSNFFFLDNIVPYVTYWNNENAYIPGLAGEFLKNGYTTKAIHPNEGGYYNRDVIYSAMGFEEFIEKKDLDFSDENVADDGWFKDEPLADVIAEEMNEGDDPQFIFAITVENHMLYESKYDETEVKLSSDKLSEDELHQLEQYTQGVYDADKFIGKMIDIVDNAKRPTIMYIWGDHLPALSAFNTLGFIDDKYNKYSTPLIAYSNYRNIEIDQEYITPNQIAPQILRDAQIKYSSYFDFIYSLRGKYPVIQKEFGINSNDELIKKYEEVQYDLLFGEQYLIGGD